MKMREWQRAVTDFHLHVGISSRLKPAKNPVLCHGVSRATLLLEEVTECVRAINARDLVEAVDGVVDTFYIGLGSCDRWGVHVAKRLEALDLRFAVTNGPHSDLNPYGAFSFYANVNSDRILAAGVKAVTTTLTATMNVPHEHDLEKCVDDLFKLFACLLTATDVWQVDLEPIFEEVHNNNMTKKGGPFSSIGKIEKPEGWKPPRVADLLRQQGVI